MCAASRNFILSEVFFERDGGNFFDYLLIIKNIRMEKYVRNKFFSFAVSDKIIKLCWIFFFLMIKYLNLGMIYRNAKIFSLKEDFRVNIILRGKLIVRI